MVVGIMMCGSTVFRTKLMIFLVFIPLTGIYAFLISIKLPLMIFYTPV